MESTQHVVDTTASTLATDSASSSNSDEPLSGPNNRNEPTKIGVYCTLRPRSLVDLKEDEARSDKERYPPRNNLTTYCTVGRRLKNFIKSNAMSDDDLPYTKLDESFSTSSTNFGMSKDLSTESIRNACEFYVLSDEESDEIEPRRSIEAINGSLLDKITGNNFKRSLMRYSARLSSMDRKRRHENFHPYCTIRRDNNERYQDTRSFHAPDVQSTAEAYDILNELDAILDNQDTTETASVSSATPEKVADYLLELDTYLDEIEQSGKQIAEEEHLKAAESYRGQCGAEVDSTKRFQRSKTLPKKSRRQVMMADCADVTTEKEKSTDNLDPDNSFDRGHKWRNTVGSSQPGNERARLTSEKPLNRRKKSWRRNSMRKTSPLETPIGNSGQNNLHSTHSPALPSHPAETLERLGTENAFHSSPQHPNHLEIRTLSHPHLPGSSVATATASPSVIMGNHVSDTGTPASLEDFHHYNTVNLTTSPSFETSQNFPEPSHELRRCASEMPVPASHQASTLTHIDIINDILQSTSSCDEMTYQHRPRQFGRRAETSPRVVSINAEMGGPTNTIPRITVNHDRPVSAPVGNLRISSLANGSASTATANNRYVSSEPSSVGSSRNPSPVSLLSSTASSSLASTNVVPPPISGQQLCASMTDEPHPNERPDSNINSQWPHGFSRTLALLCCTLGIFNISRFAVLTIHYGGNFLLQFLLLSIVFGIPMLWLQMCLGAKIKSGSISMWKISPICKGIGISLTLAQCIIALYSAVTLAWCLIYFRDSFISRNDKYRWQEPYHLFRRPSNITNNLTETVADYFNGLVLQRWQLSEDRRDQSGGVRFQIAFNVALIWIAIFLFLCKGLKSFGKVVLGLTLLPLVIFIVICCKFLYIVDFSTVQHIFSANDFEDFLVNSKSWTAAAQENFLTWGLLGPSVIAMSAKSAEKSEGKTILRRDAIIVVLLTLFGLSIAAIFGYACIQILQNNNYIYLPGSFEYTDTYTFLYSLQVPVPQDRIGVPAKWAPHYSTVIGESYRRTTSPPFRESGFQALRLITELFPATVAVATQEYISPVWTLMAYLMFLIFGLGQVCAMWKPISSILGNSTSSVLLSCVVGLLLGIPFATEMGVSIMHYLDYVIGGSWFLLILWTAQIFGVFLIRGRPYNGDLLVNDLKMASSMSAFLALSWNVLLPIGLVALAIIEYKITLSSQLFHWRGKAYFPLWSRKVGGLIQIGFLLIVPITAIVQIYRYLSSGPTDIFDRIQLLYRPPMITTQDRRRNRQNIERLAGQHQGTLGLTVSNIESQQIQDDAPPKYTPPPSYTTATGARLAKLLRQSIRRSVRRILGEPSRTRPPISITSHANTSAESSPPLESSLPPEYSTVLTNPSGEECSSPTQERIGPRALYNSHTHRTLSLERRSSRRRGQQQNTSKQSAGGVRRNTQTFTAFDVAQILRSSSQHHHPRHERSVSAIASMDAILKTSSLRHSKKTTSRSVENLVLNVAPLGESNAIVRNSASPDNNESTSVI